MPKSPTPSRKPKKTTGRGKRLNPYNIYMKKRLPEIKAKNPDLDHKAAFKKVAEEWKTCADNPKNAKGQS